jgi:glycosyltransferase involved in cell wall biosynthesis
MKNTPVPHSQLKIVQIHSGDSGGGAELMARMLHEEFRNKGHDAWFLVGTKQLSVDPERTILTPRSPSFKGELRMRLWVERALGLQYFAAPSLAGKNWPLSFLPDIVLIHSLHGANSYFRTEDISWLARKAPTYIYLQDQWIMTGHCAYSLSCDRWKIGCGKCPDLGIYPAIQKDGTRANWRRKKRTLLKSDVVLGSPAKWILDLARVSEITSHLPQFHIPNAFDPNTFHSSGRAASRAKLGLQPSEKVILFLAQQGTKSTFKDFHSLATAFQHLQQLGEKFKLVTVGDQPDAETRAALPHDVIYFPYTTDRARIADYYRSADIFCHSTKADVLPLTILESLACGTPVIGTNVGGVPEIVIPGRTGWLVPLADPVALSNAIREAFSDENELTRLQAECVTFAKEFTISKQADRFLEMFASRQPEREVRQ